MAERSAVGTIDRGAFDCKLLKLFSARSSATPRPRAASNPRQRLLVGQQFVIAEMQFPDVARAILADLDRQSAFR